MQEVKKPCGYGIVDVESQSVYDTWIILIVLCTVGSICSIVFNFLTEKPFTKGVYCLCACIGIIILLSIVSAMILAKAKVYHRWRQLLWDISVRKEQNRSGAITNARERIDKMRRDEKERANFAEAQKYKELIRFNKGIPIVQGGYGCKRNEEIVFFERGVVFCEQRTNEGYKCWKPVETGSLQITNKRIMFVGTSLNREIKINSLSSTTGYSDGFQLSQSDRVRPLLFKCKNGLLPTIVIDCISRNPSIQFLPESSVIVPKTNLDVKSDVMEEFLDSLIDASNKIAVCLKNVSKDPRVKTTVARLIDRQSVEKCNWFDISDKAVGVCVVADLFRSYIRLGHDIEDLTSPEGLCLLLVLSRIFRSEGEISRDEWKSRDFRKNMDEKFEPYICQINEILPINGSGKNLVLCDLLISSRLTKMSRSVASAMYDWAEIVSGADGCISSEEGLWLGVLRGYANGDDENTLRSNFTV